MFLNNPFSKVFLNIEKSFAIFSFIMREVKNNICKKSKTTKTNKICLTFGVSKTDLLLETAALFTN